MKMNAVQLPKLSEYDSITSAKGALDPIEIYAIADNLGIRLVPGIQERMFHPRFLTAMAVVKKGSIFHFGKFSHMGAEHPWGAGRP